MKKENATETTEKDNTGIPEVSINKMLLGLIDGVDDNTAAEILGIWERMPSRFKEAMEKLYDGLGQLGRGVDVKQIGKMLEEVRNVCGEDKSLSPFYEAAEKDVKTYAPIIIGRVNLATIEQMIQKD